jgi:hypothetical protein
MMGDMSEFGTDGGCASAVRFRESAVGPCAGDDFGSVVGDASEFGIVGGCASSRARGVETAGL